MNSNNSLEPATLAAFAKAKADNARILAELRTRKPRRATSKKSA